MVTKEETEALMIKHFPTCPLCGANTGYEVLGYGFSTQRNHVQCRTCQAKWWSTDFIHGKQLKQLQLKEASTNGKGSMLKNRTFPTEFWQNPQSTESQKNQTDKINKPEINATRLTILLIYTTAFIIALAQIATIPAATWRYIDLQLQLTLAFSITMGLAGVLLAYCVYEDGKHIQILEDAADYNTNMLEERIDKLEQKNSQQN